MIHNLICKQCSKNFSSVTFRQCFCSKSCATTFTNKLRPIKTKQLKYCKECQTPIYDNAKIFCNHSCSAKYSNKRRQPASITSKIKVSKSIKRYHANKLCRISFCKNCNKCIPIRNRKSCSDECKKILMTTAGKKGGKNSALKRVLRSKDEIKLFNLCDNYFHNVQHNVPIINGWDADIILPDHKIAILWNGPWHYKQLSLKNHSLLQVQTRDKIKMDTLIKYNWKVMIFEDRYYTPELAFEQIKNGCVRR